MGEKFDPNIHEAIFTLPESEHPNNHVGAVMQSGWKIGDRVLRAAKVGIVKKWEGWKERGLYILNKVCGKYTALNVSKEEEREVERKC